MAFCDRLKHLRIEAGLTQDELAKRLGVAKSTISMYERGERRPDFELAEAIADFFDVKLTYLVGNSPEEKERDAKFKNTIALTDSERDLLMAFRKADDQTRRIVAYALKVKEFMK